MGANWGEINETMSQARAAQPPAQQAQWDQLVATLEAEARQHGVDLTDPLQARAALLGASTLLNTVRAVPLWPLFGAPWFEARGLTALAVFASFIPKDPS